jgi:hypothetical protein
MPSSWRNFDYTPVSVLATPMLVAPVEGQHFSNYPRTITLGWQAVPGANAYRVDVDYGNPGPRGSISWTSLYSKNVVIPSFTFDFVGSQPGRWRVTALDQTGVHHASQSSEWRGFDYTPVALFKRPGKVELKKPIVAEIPRDKIIA